MQEYQTSTANKSNEALELDLFDFLRYAFRKMLIVMLGLRSGVRFPDVPL